MTGFGSSGVYVYHIIQETFYWFLVGPWHCPSSTFPIFPSVCCALLICISWEKPFMLFFKLIYSNQSFKYSSAIYNRYLSADAS